MALSDIVAGNLIIGSELLAAFNQVKALTAVKTADETVTSSTTLQDDNELFASVAANTTYELTGWLYVASTSNTPDMKLGYTGPSGATLVHSAWGQQTGATTNTGSPDTGVHATISGVHTKGVINGNLSILLHGTLVVSSTAGTFRFQWAQQTSDAAGTTVKAGSWIKLTPVTA